MTNHKTHLATHKKAGAALIIVLGFLAILTVVVIAFSARSQTGRLEARAHIYKAQTRHLQDAAIARALAQIDEKSLNRPFPPFMSLHSSSPDQTGFLKDSIDFSTLHDFVQTGNPLIRSAYSRALRNAQWQTISDLNNQPIGRIGYIILNTSGLLDINEVGDIDASGAYRTRSTSKTPAEIQLIADDLLIPEFNQSQTMFPHFSPDSPSGVLRKASDTDLSAGFALAHNRTAAWKRFETIRDIKQLGIIGSPNIFTTDIASFSTWSFDPSIDQRSFMGTNSATLNESAIRAAMPGAVDADFVINQIRDYIDEDALPTDSDGVYTDFSVEPVPLINEIILSMETDFIPVASESVDENGQAIIDYVTVSNQVSLEVELWYPFIGYTNDNAYAVYFNDIYSEPAASSNALYGDISQWDNYVELDADIATPESGPITHSIVFTNFVTEVSSNEFIEAFEVLDIEIYIDEFVCVQLGLEPEEHVVDSVRNMTFELDELYEESLEAQLSDLAESLFENGATNVTADLQFEIGSAAVDPRLNWNADNTNQWLRVDDQDLYNFSVTRDEINPTIITEHQQDESQDVYVRNADRIDSPYEFTHLMMDRDTPWKTFDMLKPYDEYLSRFIMANLSTYPNGPPKRGRVNPYSPHTNVIASVFMNIPLTSYSPDSAPLVTAEQAHIIAEHFMEYIAENGWPENAASYGDSTFINKLRAALNIRDPLILEALFRHSHELFTTRDTLFTIIPVAQAGIDFNEDGHISNDEVTATEQAIMYLWRDPVTGKSAPVFYGTNDTLTKEPNWGTLLDAFRP